MKNLINHIKIIAVSLFILSWNVAMAQPKITASIEEIAEIDSKTAFTYFKPELKINPLTVFEVYKDKFGLSAQDEMRSFRSTEMPFTGIILTRYQQYYNGYKVAGAVTNLYHKDGVALKTNGRLIKNFINDKKATITESVALQNALDFIPAKDYAWLDAKLVERMQLKKKDPSLTLFPAGVLVYIQPKNKHDFKSEDFLLCWKFDVGMSRSNSQCVYVDATNGEVVNDYPLDASCNGTTIQLPYNGNQTVYTSVQNRCTNTNDYEMWDDCNGANIILEDYDTSDPKCNTISGNTWTYIAGTTSDAAQVNWGMRTTYQYHFAHFNWTSYDNLSTNMDCFVGYNFLDDSGNESGNNAAYTYWENFVFGYGGTRLNDSDSYTTLDIVAHEFTHGVDEYSANLTYSDESGALDESFADIFGEIVEMATENNWTTPTWQHAEDRTNVNYHRSFINPNAKNDPDTYTGSYWYSGTGDNGGVHINSGVQNHFFYLLVEGGTSVNDLGNNYHVDGININDAILIAWTAHQYLFSSAQYIDSRDAWIEAAKDIFGNCSNQMIQVGNAWHAVGVGAQSPYYSTVVTGLISAVTTNNTKDAINHVYTAGLTDINSLSGSFEVRFYSAGEVTLNTGFTAPSGCAFRAKVNPCSVTLHSPIRNANPTVTNDNGSIATSGLLSSLTIVPNPFTDLFACRFNSIDDESQGTISLFDALGKLVLNSPCSIEKGINEFKIDASIMQPGLYNLVLNTKSGKMYSQKIVKQ